VKFRSKMTPFLIFICAATLILAQSSSVRTPKREYFGQKPSGKKPKIFAPGFISTGKAELNSVFTPDGREFYFAIYTPGRGCKMYFTKDNGSGWSQPEPVPFSSQYSDVDMCITPDGTRMYFGSTRPVNGIEQKDSKIWYVDREGDGWSKAKDLAMATFTGCTQK